MNKLDLQNDHSDDLAHFESLLDTAISNPQSPEADWVIFELPTYRASGDAFVRACETRLVRQAKDGDGEIALSLAAFIIAHTREDQKKILAIDSISTRDASLEGLLLGLKVWEQIDERAKGPFAPKILNWSLTAPAYVRFLISLDGRYRMLRSSAAS